MRTWILAAGLGGVLAVTAALQAGDEKAKETPDDSTPTVIVVGVMKSGHADSEKVSKSIVQPLRDEFGAKDVLFLTADVSSLASRHQAKLLLNSLDLASVWKKQGSKPGSVVIVDVLEGEAALVADAKTAVDKAKKTISDILKKELGDEDEPEDEPEEGDDEAMD